LVTLTYQRVVRGIANSRVLCKAVQLGLIGVVARKLGEKFPRNIIIKEEDRGKDVSAEG